MSDLDHYLEIKKHQPSPKVVCLSGSLRFWQTWQDVALAEELAGKIVLTIARSDEEIAEMGLVLDKEQLVIMHLFRIEKADEILILNVGGYIGESTAREIEYATRLKKPIRWLEDIPLRLALVSQQRGMPWLRCGMRVKVNGLNNLNGTIIDGNMNNNLSVLFDGHEFTSNCHPLWQITYYDKSGNIIVEYKD